MKKVLLGLLALSAVSMAAAPTYDQEATTNTNVFQTGQQGAISVTGKITSTIPVVKYVVFASMDGTTAEDKLNLKEYVLSQDESKVGFQGANPKVYVKRVNGANNGFIDLETSDVVETTYAMHGNTNPASEPWLSQPDHYMNINETRFVSKSTLESIAASIGGLEAVEGKLKLTANGKEYYHTNRFIQLNVVKNGVFELRTGGYTSLLGPNTLPADKIAAIENAFAGGKAVEGIKILVRVK